MPFATTSLEQLCSRPGRIKSVYSKCGLVDMAPNQNESIFISESDRLLDVVLETLERADVSTAIRSTEVLAHCRKLGQARAGSIFASGFVWKSICQSIGGAEGPGRDLHVPSFIVETQAHTQGIRWDASASHPPQESTFRAK